MKNRPLFSALLFALCALPVLSFAEDWVYSDGFMTTSSGWKIQVTSLSDTALATVDNGGMVKAAPAKADRADGTYTLDLSGPIKDAADPTKTYSLTTIGYYAFNGGVDIGALVLPKSVTTWRLGDALGVFGRNGSKMSSVFPKDFSRSITWSGDAFCIGAPMIKDDLYLKGVTGTGNVGLSFTHGGIQRIFFDKGFATLYSTTFANSGATRYDLTFAGDVPKGIEDAAHGTGNRAILRLPDDNASWKTWLEENVREFITVDVPGFKSVFPGYEDPLYVIVSGKFKGGFVTMKKVPVGLTLKHKYTEPPKAADKPADAPAAAAPKSEKSAQEKPAVPAGTTDSITLLPPSYRGMVSVARRDASVRFGYVLHAENGGVPGLEVKAQIRNASGKTVSEATFRTAAESPAFFTVPLAADAPEGVYTLTAEWKTKKGKERQTAKFKVVPVRPRQFFVDQDGTLLKEGKPFFPLGIYHAHGWQIDEWLPLGVNTIQLWSWDWYDNYTLDESLWNKKPADDAQRAEMLAKREANLKKLEENDIFVLFEDDRVWNELILQTYGRFGPPEKWETTPYPFETNTAFRARIEAVIKDPRSRVAMWYLADEVGGGGWIPKLQRAGKFFQDRDEDHPTISLSAGDHSLEPCADVYAFDCYPRYYGGTGEVTRLSSSTEAAYNRMGAYKPIIVVPQAFGKSEKQPTELPEHVRAMSYLSIVRGAKGIFWYCWKQTGDWNGSQKQGMGWNPPTAKEVQKVIAEVKVFSDALLAPNPTFLTSEDGLTLGILAGDDSTGRFLIYVNGDLTKESNATLSVPLPKEAVLEPLFDGPAATLKNGKISLKVPALGTGAFRVK